MSNISPFLSSKFEILFSSKENSSFLHHSLQKRPTTIFVNTKKISIASLQSFLKRKGIFTEIILDNLLIVKESNFSLGTTVEYLNGCYYLMGASSCYAIMALSKLIKNENYSREKELKILDMCAAPGGKSVVLTTLLENPFSLFCVEKDETRAKALSANMIRMDIECVVVVDDVVKALNGNIKNLESKNIKSKKNIESKDYKKNKKNIESKESRKSKENIENVKSGKKLKKSNDIPNDIQNDESSQESDKVSKKESKIETNINNGYFPKMDIIILDVPCSGSGTLSKDLNVRLLDEPTLHSLNSLQYKMILSAFDNLKSNGILIYSTCSVLVEENEMIIEYLLNKRKSAKILENDGIGKKGFTGFRGKQFNKDMKNAKRIFPHTHNGDGFFYCFIRRCN